MSESDDDLALDEKLARMSALFDEAIKSAVTDHALEWLASAQLLLKITSQDVDVAGEAVHTSAGREAAAREFDALPYEQRKALVQQVMQHWAVNTSAAVKRLWHASEVLGFDPETIPPDAVALVAATYLSEDVDALVKAITK